MDMFLLRLRAKQGQRTSTRMFGCPKRPACALSIRLALRIGVQRCGSSCVSSHLCAPLCPASRCRDGGSDKRVCGLALPVLGFCSRPGPMASRTRSRTSRGPGAKCQSAGAEWWAMASAEAARLGDGACAPSLPLLSRCHRESCHRRSPGWGWSRRARLHLVHGATAGCSHLDQGVARSSSAHQGAWANRAHHQAPLSLPCCTLASIAPGAQRIAPAAAPPVAAAAAAAAAAATTANPLPTASTPAAAPLVKHLLGEKVGRHLLVLVARQVGLLRPFVRACTAGTRAS